MSKKNLGPRKLVDLNPWFVDAGGDGIKDADGKPVPLKRGVGISYDCPCGCNETTFLRFENPLDGSEPRTDSPKWKRTGDTFETITLTPSIQRVDGCMWHGYLTDGVLTEC